MRPSELQNMYLHKIYRQVKLMVLKQTQCLWTLHSMGLLYSAFPGASVSKHSLNYIHILIHMKKSGTAGNKEK